MIPQNCDLNTENTEVTEEKPYVLLTPILGVLGGKKGLKRSPWDVKPGRHYNVSTSSLVIAGLGASLRLNLKTSGRL